MVIVVFGPVGYVESFSFLSTISQKLCTSVTIKTEAEVVWYKVQVSLVT